MVTLLLLAVLVFENLDGATAALVLELDPPPPRLVVSSAPVTSDTVCPAHRLDPGAAAAARGCLNCSVVLGASSAAA